MTLANHNHRGPPPWETSSGRSASRPSSFSSPFATSSDTKRVVFVSVRVIQIGNISERDQTFEARMDVFVEWNDPQSKKLSAVELEKIATTCIREKKAGHWWEVRSSSRERLLARPRLLTPPPQPVIRYSSANSYSREKKIYLTRQPRSDKEPAKVGFRETIQGVFRADFDLADFPFDVQSLPIELTVGREIISHELLSVDKVELADSPDNPNMMLPMRDPEWAFRVPRYKAGDTGLLAGVGGKSMVSAPASPPVLPLTTRLRRASSPCRSPSRETTRATSGTTSSPPRSSAPCRSRPLPSTRPRSQIGWDCSSPCSSSWLPTRCRSAPRCPRCVRHCATRHVRRRAPFTFPQVGYLTLMDKYFLLIIVLMIALYAQSSVIGSITSDWDPSDARSLDLQCMQAAVLALLAMMLVAYCSAVLALRKRLRRVASFGAIDDELIELLEREGLTVKDGVVQGWEQYWARR